MQVIILSACLLADLSCFFQEGWSEVKPFCI